MVQRDVSVVLKNPERGVYSVCGKLWVVGARYRLHEHVGAGSYGDVCWATDVETQEAVALKRIPDVFLCHMLAKRVLREVCIMRRLQHPYIIALTDVFTSPNLEIEGGIDLYIATEYADGGDMYHLRKPLDEKQVQFLIWQLLNGTRYLHSCNVWHRDIKSENVLLSSKMDVKICDFGLSRSAMESSVNVEPRRVPTGRRSSSKKPVLMRQYTKTVVTPSYRAPEVIMSQGQYTSAIDIWALGCIFWELLERQLSPQYTGPPPRPLFGVRGEPNTPTGGELYAEDGHSKLSEQLDVIFDVIGTPCWKDIESVPSESWRSYLKQVPGRAGNLGSNLSVPFDEEALDLLSRMLAFDPARRCTAEEALAHTYFKNLRYSADLPPLSPSHAPLRLPENAVWQISDPAVALGILERELENSISEKDGGRRTLEWLLQREVDSQQEQLKQRTAKIKNDMMVPQTVTNMASASVLPLFPVFPPPTPILVGNSGAVADWPPEYQIENGDAGLSLNISVGLKRDAGDDVTVENSRNAPPKKKTIIRHRSLRIERESDPLLPATGGNRASSRLAKQKIGEGQYQNQPGAEGFPRRSPRLRDIHTQGELPHRKRVTLRG